MKILSSLHPQALSIPNRNGLVTSFSPVPADKTSPDTPTITVNYQDSSIISFRLHSFYYAYSSAIELSLTSLPISCNIIVTDFGPPSSGFRQIATQTFEYVSNSDLNQDIIEDTFLSTFTGLYNTVFELSSVDNATTAGLIDNIANTIVSNSPVVVN